jgi:hypothetical protein
LNPSVQIVGLQRSGTTWLGTMVRNNYAVNCQRMGKHHMPKEYAFPTLDATLVIRKRVDHWLGSIGRQKKNLHQLRRRLYRPDGTLDKLKAHALHTEFYDAWHAEPGVVMIEYATLLREPEMVLGEIAKRLKWQRIDGQTTFNLEGPSEVPDWRRKMYLER